MHEIKTKLQNQRQKMSNGNAHHNKRENFFFLPIELKSVCQLKISTIIVARLILS